MPIQYDIIHTTVYRYRQPVMFGEHRVMFRPRDSHDLRVLATDLEVSPDADVRMIQDPHSNSVALVQPLEPADELKIVCSFTIEHAHSLNLELPLAPSAELFPFAYSVDERFDLEHYLRPAHDDPGGELTAWARQFIRTDGPTNTRDLLIGMNQHIREQFRYAARDEEGTQEPSVTLELGSGSCRDFAPLDDGSGAPPRHRDPLRLRLPVRPGARRRAGRRHPRRRLHARLAAGLPARRRLGAVRPDQQPARRQPTDPGRRGAPPVAGSAHLGQLVRRERRLHRHVGQGVGAAPPVAVSDQTRRCAGVPA
jgi:hypothetical protein